MLRRQAIRAPFTVTLLVLGYFVAWFNGCISFAQPMRPESPRINALEGRLSQDGVAATEAFWREVAEQGAPLVESLPGEERYRLVTFLWRGQTDTRHVLIVGGVTPSWGYSKDDAGEKLMARLQGTDVWYKTYRVRSDVRATYLLSPNDPLNDPLVEHKVARPGSLIP